MSNSNLQNTEIKTCISIDSYRTHEANIFTETFVFFCNYDFSSPFDRYP